MILNFAKGRPKYDVIEDMQSEAVAKEPVSGPKSFRAEEDEQPLYRPLTPYRSLCRIHSRLYPHAHPQTQRTLLGTSSRYPRGVPFPSLCSPFRLPPY